MILVENLKMEISKADKVFSKINELIEFEIDGEYNDMEIVLKEQCNEMKLDNDKGPSLNASSSFFSVRENRSRLPPPLFSTSLALLCDMIFFI